MADVWVEQLELHGYEWGVPGETVTNFKNQRTAAKTLLAEVTSSSRNKINTEQCRVMFHELWLTMQFLKANYFNSPPRTSAEIIALLLSLHDDTHTPIFIADVVPGISLHNTDGHGLLVKLFMDGTPSDIRSADHFFGKWGAKPIGRWATPEEAAADSRLLTRPPTRPEDLPQHFSTSRKKYELDFGLADIGMEAHITVCWQTPGNQDGPYCPIVSRIIA
jgi:hypothetical protein